MARMVSWGRPCSSVQMVWVYCVSSRLGFKARRSELKLAASTSSFRNNRGYTSEFKSVSLPARRGHGAPQGAQYDERQRDQQCQPRCDGPARQRGKAESQLEWEIIQGAPFDRDAGKPGRLFAVERDLFQVDG